MKKLIVLFIVVLCSFVVSCSGGSMAKGTSSRAPKANGAGVIPAIEWKDSYPDQYDSYKENIKNSATYSYLEEHPQMLTLFHGFGYEKSFTAARGHVYSLYDPTISGRPHPRAACLTCKSADYTALVNADSSNYGKPYEEIYAQVYEPISCYNCHENDVATVTPTHQYLKNAMANENVDARNLVCGQCHVDYYFKPGGTFEVTLPYDSVAGTHPDKMIEWYDNMGFADWTNPDTGTKHIFVQHTEFETNLQQGSHFYRGAANTCSACHMGEEDGANGVYTSHYWRSPFDNVALMEKSCVQCHGDVNEFISSVKAKQADVVKYTFEVADKIVELNNKLAAAVKAGRMSESQLDELRDLNRHAQFYWNYVVTENSDGAHNFTITKYCLDKANNIVEDALTKI